MNVTERTRVVRIESILEAGKVTRMQAAYITEYVTDDGAVLFSKDGGVAGIDHVEAAAKLDEAAVSAVAAIDAAKVNL